MLLSAHTMSRESSITMTPPLPAMELHAATHAQDARAGVVRLAQFGVFRATHADDVLHVAERLDVVHDDRALVETEDGGEIRRLDAGIGALAFERFDEAGLLAANVGTRAAMHVDFTVEAAAEDVLSEEIFRPRLGERLFQNDRALGKFTADVDVGEVRADRKARDDHPLDELMRILMDDVAILKSAGLGLVRVADEVHRLRIFLFVDESPLHSARK